MNVNEALEKALRILDEEQARPTLNYRYVSDQWPSNQPYQHQKGVPPAIAASLGLMGERQGNRPRNVYEDPKLYLFESTNFDLLLKIFSQVGEQDRVAFVSALLEHVRKPTAARGHKLLAEFLVRTGYLKDLLEALEQPPLPVISLMETLIELEEMLALNFNLFSDTELESMPKSLAHLREVAERQTYSARLERSGRGTTRGTTQVRNPHYREGYSAAGKAIVAVIDGIIQECKQARYWYLKGVLQERPNLEIESDKLKVEDFLAKLGFSADMVRAMNEAESDYKATSNAFELKNCLSHLRSFLEHLHRDTAKAIAASKNGTVVDKWGDATIYLREQGYFTLQHERFSASLYTLLSDESVHPLTAEREYARLLRNVVIEYGVMFLTMLDKRGVQI